jgi:carboxylesterase type B
VWIYGGGYTAGSKASSGSPAGLVAQSEIDNNEGIIYVAMNYRLGLFVSFNVASLTTHLTLPGLDVGSNIPEQRNIKRRFV